MNWEISDNQWAKFTPFTWFNFGKSHVSLICIPDDVVCCIRSGKYQQDQQNHCQALHGSQVKMLLMDYWLYYESYLHTKSYKNSRIIRFQITKYFALYLIHSIVWNFAPKSYNKFSNHEILYTISKPHFCLKVPKIEITICRCNFGHFGAEIKIYIIRKKFYFV